MDGISLTLSGTTDTWDFELPAADASDAVIGSATVTATGADVVIDLSASALSVEPRVFTIEVEGQAPQTVTLDPGETTSITVERPVRDDGHHRAHAERRRGERDGRRDGPGPVRERVGLGRDTTTHRHRGARDPIRIARWSRILLILGAVSFVALLVRPVRRSDRAH